MAKILCNIGLLNSIRRLGVLMLVLSALSETSALADQEPLGTSSNPSESPLLLHSAAGACEESESDNEDLEINDPDELITEEFQGVDDLDRLIGSLLEATTRRNAEGAKAVLYKLWVRDIGLEVLYERYVDRTSVALLSDADEAWVVKQNVKLQKQLSVQIHEQRVLATTLESAVKKRKKKSLKQVLGKLNFSKIPLEKFMRQYVLKFSKDEQAWVCKFFPDAVFWNESA